jgi:hypothetical protein
MGRFLQVAQRALLLIVVWGLAAAVVVQAALSYITHRRLVREVAGMQADYKQKVADWAAQLAEGEKLQSDKQYQVELLKKRFGYTRPNETPIIIDREDPASTEQGAAQ